MIRYIGPGLVLNAIVQEGFRNVYDHFDLAHFTKVDATTGRVIRLIVTFEHVQNPHPPELAPVNNDSVLPLLEGALPPLLVQVARALMQVNCMITLLDSGSRSDRNLVLFERLDTTPLVNGLLGTRVKVYGSSEPVIGGQGSHPDRCVLFGSMES
jgi:hypothetical protein